MIIGVDFGNINSFPAAVLGINEKTHLGGSEEALLPPQDARLGIPSLFHCNKRGDFKYGKAAQNAAPINNRRDLIKRRIGTSEVIGTVTVNYNDVITNMIKHIVDTANRELANSGRETTNSISLAYPVGKNFTRGQIEVLRGLAEKAVLENGQHIKVAGMIPEPAAAALEFLGTLPVVRREQNITVLVYDLGGGTFDTSIVNAHQNSSGVMESYQVLGQDGLDRAGNEFTDILEKLARDKFTVMGTPLPKSDKDKADFRREVEERKIDLSTVNSVDFEGSDGSTVTVEKREFEARVRSLIAETIGVARRLYDSSNPKPQRIVMTGGQSQMPLIKTMLQTAFPEIPGNMISIYKPQQAIALGAARFGGLNCVPPSHSPETRQNSRNDHVLVRTESGHMIGISRVVNGNSRHYVKEFIPAHTPIPMDKPIKQEGFSPRTPCTKHYISLVQANNDKPDIYDDNQFAVICTLCIDFHITTPAQPEFDIEVYIDQTNAIHFSASDPKGKFNAVTTIPDYFA